MKMSMYVIYDRLALESGPIFEAKNDAVAGRKYLSALTDVLAGRDGEYRLLRVGSMDHDTQKLVLEDPPIEVPVYNPEKEVENG
nr:MAG: nonstructural protein [Microvirus sp.]